jgi:hypothetical protein
MEVAGGRQLGSAEEDEQHRIRLGQVSWPCEATGCVHPRRHWKMALGKHGKLQVGSLDSGTPTNAKVHRRVPATTSQSEARVCPAGGSERIACTEGCMHPVVLCISPPPRVAQHRLPAGTATASPSSSVNEEPLQAKAMSHWRRLPTYVRPLDRWATGQAGSRTVPTKSRRMPLPPPAAAVAAADDGPLICHGRRRAETGSSCIHRRQPSA